MESNNLNWMKNERAKNYAARARRFCPCGQSYMRKALNLQFSIYLFWVKIKELLIEFTICKTLGYVRIGYHNLCVVSSKSNCFCGLESLFS